MAHFIGEPTWLQECQPGDLLRVSHRGSSRFALAVCGNTLGHVDRVVIFDEADSFPLVQVDGTEPVISYGRNYRLQESMLPDSLSATDRFQAGRINWRSNKGEQSANLMVTVDQRSTSYVDVDTGRVSVPKGNGAFSMGQWSMILTAEDGSDVAEVFTAP